MTKLDEILHNRRVEDADSPPSLRTRFLMWYAAWGRLISLFMGGWLVVVSVVLVLLAIDFKRAEDDRASRNHVTELQSQKACMRTKLIAPFTLKDYERRHVMPAVVLREYRSAIPKTC